MTHRYALQYQSCWFFSLQIGTGKLMGPKGVAVDNNGHIIVVDNKASCVLVFQSNGKLLHKFGSRGNEDYQFAGPHYAAITKNNDIIVSDFHNHCVKVKNIYIFIYWLYFIFLYH